MARENKNGTSFCALSLEISEEKLLKKHLKDKDISAKQYLRYLVRKDMKENGLLQKAESILKYSKS